MKGEMLLKAVESVTDSWRKQRKKEDRGRPEVKTRRRRVMRCAAYEYSDRVTVKEAAYACMEAAYMKASAGGTLPAHARQIMYAARPTILENAQDRYGEPLELRSDYFTQTLLPDYMNEHSGETKGWDVVFDARGQPKAIPVNIDGIPDELKWCDQWVAWRLENRNGKWTKPPWDPLANKPAKSTDPSTWGSFEDVLEAYRTSNRWSGVGFVFSADDPYCGVDLDHCRDPGTGAIEPWAAEIIAMLATYTEVSPSGTGVKLIGKGSLPGIRRRKGNIEMYDGARYFTITGHHVEGAPHTVQDINESIQTIYATVFETSSGKRKMVTHNADQVTETNECNMILKNTDPVPGIAEGQTTMANTYSPPTDDMVLARAMDAGNGSKLRSLWGGDHSGYRSQSEADASMACILAFWSRDPAQVKRIMLRSDNQLCREKWDRDDYLDGTIDNALATVTESYKWKDVPPVQRQIFSLTDTGNAERFAALHGDQARYCHPWGKWFAWDGRHWRLDDTGQIELLAKATARSILQEAAHQPDDERRKVLVDFARASESAARRAAMVRLAQSESGIPVLPEELDLDPWVLNCPNGTLDLRTGTLRKHSRLDKITKLCPVEYVAGAECPTWARFLDTIFRSNTELIGFVRRLLGYCLTGDVSEHVLPIFHGKGANGKSTLINAMFDVLGPDYAMKAAPDLLLMKKSAHPTERADLFGKRFVACNETDRDHQLAEALVKDLTGGDRIRARRMKEDFWEFAPTHKILVATNHRPAIRGTDNAIWRRIRLVPFNATIPAQKQDKAMPEKLRAELPGILAWCVRGCLAWQQQGLGEPQAVSSATADYRADEDILGNFIEEACVVEQGVRARSSDLYEAYKEYTRQLGEEAVSRRRFGEELTEREYARHTSNGVWYLGIGLRS